jgi:hypothetical protein
MKHLCQMALALLLSVFIHNSAQAAIIIVDLRADLNFQNQKAAIPIANGNDQSLFHHFSIPNIEVGNGTFSLNFSLANGVSASGNITEREGRIEAIQDMVHPLYNPGLLALNAGTSIDDTLTWNNENKNVAIFRYIHVIAPESTSNAGDFNDGIERFAGFRLQDGADYYYGYLQMQLIDYPDEPAISIAGYAIETTANQPILITAIPEPSTSALMLSALSMLMLLRHKRTR